MRAKVTVLVAGLALVVLAAAPAVAEGPSEAALTGVRAMTAGSSHSCALLQSGQVRCAGRNAASQLGNGSADTTGHTHAVPVRNVAGTGRLTDVIALTAGGDHTCALLAGGQARCWGDNEYGQLGDGSDDPSTIPVVVRNPADTGPLAGIRSLSAGHHHTCAVLTNGRARCWGDDTYGQIGDGSLGPGIERHLPTVVEDELGSGSLAGVTQIDAGTFNTCVRLGTGQARCWGLGDQGANGNGTTDPATVPTIVLNVAGTAPLTRVRRISVGGHHACAVLTNDQARCWGTDGDGQLGNDLPSGDHARPIVVKSTNGTGVLENVRTVDAGDAHSCALLRSGQVRCWGQNTLDQQGNGVEAGDDRTRPTAVRNGTNTGWFDDAIQLHTTDSHTCVTLRNHQARCWGANDGGALGNGHTTPSPLPVTFTT